MYNVKDFGALGNGENLDSSSIQKAIDECSANGGGTPWLHKNSVAVIKTTTL